MPKMSFGTGHHATTWLVSRAVLDLDVAGRTGLDMGERYGCAVDRGGEVRGFARRRGGHRRLGRRELPGEHRGERSCGPDHPVAGDVRRIAGRRYGFILANINRNILLADMPSYAATLEPGGDLVMSGFLEADVPAIVSRAKELGMEHVETASREGWQMVHVRKTE